MKFKTRKIILKIPVQTYNYKPCKEKLKGVRTIVSYYMIMLSLQNLKQNY